MCLSNIFICLLYFFFWSVHTFGVVVSVFICSLALTSFHTNVSMCIWISDWDSTSEFSTKDTQNRKTDTYIESKPTGNKDWGLWGYDMCVYWLILRAHFMCIYTDVPNNRYWIKCKFATHVCRCESEKRRFFLRSICWPHLGFLPQLFSRFLPCVF